MTIDSQKSAMISGITGQDGGYLAKYYCRKITDNEDRSYIGFRF